MTRLRQSSTSVIVAFVSDVALVVAAFLVAAYLAGGWAVEYPMRG